MESKSTNSEVASFALPLQDYQEQVEFSLLKTDKSKMENLCFCRQAVTLELWMKQTQNLKGFLKLPGMVKQSKSTKGYRVVLLNSHKNYGNGLKLNFFDSKFREIDLKMTKNDPKCPKITRNHQK